MTNRNPIYTRAQLEEAKNMETAEHHEILDHVLLHGVIDGEGETIETNQENVAEQTQEETHQETVQETIDEGSEEEPSLDPRLADMQSLLEEAEAKNLALLKENEKLNESVKYLNEQTRSSIKNKEGFVAPKREDFDNEFSYNNAVTESMKEFLLQNSDSQGEEVLETPEESNIESTMDAATHAENVDQRALMADEFETFWSKHPEMNPGIGFNQAERKYQDTFDAIKRNFGATDNEVVKMLSRLQDKDLADSTRNMLRKKGVNIDEPFEKIYQSVQVYNYMMGQKLIPSTGRYTYVKDSSGRVATQEDMSTALFLMDRKNILLKTKIEAYQEVHDQIDRVKNQGAISTEPTALSEFKDDGKDSIAYQKNILDIHKKDPTKYLRDHEFAKELNRVLEMD